MRLAADRIEPYKTPQGDGNFDNCELIEVESELNLIKPRKGTETFIQIHDIFKHCIIEPYKTPQGDGNLLSSISSSISTRH